MSTITLAEARSLLNAPKQRPHKYRAKGFYDEHNIWWASKHEHKVWCELQLRKKLGEITDLRRQVPYKMTEQETGLSETLRMDFVFVDLATGKTVVMDAKGHKTRDYLRKKKRFEALFGTKIVEV